MMTRAKRPRSAALGAAALMTLCLGATRVSAHPSDDPPPPPALWEDGGARRIPPPPPPPPGPPMVRRLDRIADLTPEQERHARHLMLRARAEARPLVREMWRDRRLMREARVHGAPPPYMARLERHQRQMRRELGEIRMRARREIVDELAPEQRRMVQREMRERRDDRREAFDDGPRGWRDGGAPERDGDLRARRDALRRERDDLLRERDEMRRDRDGGRRHDDRKDDDGWEDPR